jgi:hypothetical protein
MPKKSHELTSVSITVEVHEAVKKAAAEGACFEYEIIDAAVKQYLK